jgi:hypothetical protein
MRIWPTIAAAAASWPAPAPAAPAAPAAPFWTWSSPAGRTKRLDIDLIRGRIRIVRREGPVAVEIFRELGDGRAAEVEIKLEAQGEEAAIMDAYPPRIGGDECLPPVDERGDYWTNQARFEAVVRAPRSVHVSARVKDGAVEGE